MQEMQETLVQSSGSEDTLEKVNGNPLKHSCLENTTDRGASWATVHGVAKSWTWLSMHTHVTEHPGSTVTQAAGAQGEVHMLLVQSPQSGNGRMEWPGHWVRTNRGHHMANLSAHGPPSSPAVHNWGLWTKKDASYMSWRGTLMWDTRVFRVEKGVTLMTSGTCPQPSCPQDENERDQFNYLKGPFCFNFLNYGTPGPARGLALSCSLLASQPFIRVLQISCP